MSYRIPVAIAGPDLEMGLLGQDFLQRYDVSLRSDRIEFHPRR
jgi:aspartyl protease family protein